MQYGGLMQLVSYGAQDVYLYDNHAYYVKQAKQYIARSLKRAFQRKKWHVLLQFVKHRNFSLTIQNELADVSYHL